MMEKNSVEYFCSQSVLCCVLVWAHSISPRTHSQFVSSRHFSVDTFWSAVTKCWCWRPTQILTPFKQHSDNSALLFLMVGIKKMQQSLRCCDIFIPEVLKFFPQCNLTASNVWPLIVYFFTIFVSAGISSELWYLSSCKRLKNPQFQCLKILWRKLFTLFFSLIWAFVCSFVNYMDHSAKPEMTSQITELSNFMIC